MEEKLIAGGIIDYPGINNVFRWNSDGITWKFYVLATGCIAYLFEKIFSNFISPILINPYLSDDVRFL